MGKIFDAKIDDWLIFILRGAPRSRVILYGFDFRVGKKRISIQTWSYPKKIFPTNGETHGNHCWLKQLLQAFKAHSIILMGRSLRKSEGYVPFLREVVQEEYRQYHYMTKRGKGNA